MGFQILCLSGLLLYKLHCLQLLSISVVDDFLPMTALPMDSTVTPLTFQSVPSLCHLATNI
jgi:hypothetical protein